MIVCTNKIKSNFDVNTMFEQQTSKNKKTQKVKQNLSHKEKEKLWNIFENEKQNPTSLEENIECIYTAKQENLVFKKCQSPLMIMEEGFQHV